MCSLGVRNAADAWVGRTRCRSESKMVLPRGASSFERPQRSPLCRIRGLDVHEVERIAGFNLQNVRLQEKQNVVIMKHWRDDLANSSFNLCESKEFIQVHAPI